MSEITEHDLIIAFVRGAQWWEYHKTGATMWPSDRDIAEAEAVKRFAGSNTSHLLKRTQTLRARPQESLKQAP